MFLVAGLAVAGLVGIAAAFYFSIRSGNRGNKRLRSAGAGRADAGRLPGAGRADPGRLPGSRSGRNPRPERTDNGRRAAGGSTGPDSVPDFGDQVLVGGRRGAPGGSATPGGQRPSDSRPSDSRPSDSGAKPRRRGFRKGADVDEEMWPAESFGGVSDEQFWDDMASDKPLTTTARTAQQDPGTRNRPLDAGPTTDPQAVPARGDDRKRDSVTRNDRRRGEGGRSEGRRGPGSGAYPGPRTAPNPATERTAIQPAYAATQPVQSMTQPVQSMTQPVQSMTSQRPDATRPVRAPAGTSQPMSAASQPRGAANQPATQPATQPAEPRRRRPSSAEEDPLTSAAFSLRSSGPVDGRSSLRARDTTRDQYDAGGSGPGSAGSYGGTSPYPYTTPSYGDSSSATQTMNTPPYGENYGYGGGAPAPQADEPRRQNGNRSHARPDGLGDGTRTARQAYPREARQATGSYPASSAHPASSARPGNSAYPGNGHQGNGHRAPYDPRDDYRRLTHQH